jgi:hypothetical protein
MSGEAEIFVNAKLESLRDSRHRIEGQLPPWADQ